MKKILVVVDYQKDFVDGSLGFAGAEKLDALLAQRIRRAAEQKEVIVYTQDSHTAEYLQTREGRNLPVSHCLIGSDGWQVYGQTRQALTDVKATGFLKEAFGLKMDAKVLAKLPPPSEVAEIEVAGLVSNICVLSNVVLFQTYFPQATMIVDAQLTASFDPVLNEQTLAVLAGLQVQVLNHGKE